MHECRSAKYQRNLSAVPMSESGPCIRTLANGLGLGTIINQPKVEESEISDDRANADADVYGSLVGQFEY